MSKPNPEGGRALKTRKPRPVYIAYDAGHDNIGTGVKLATRSARRAADFVAENPAFDLMKLELS